MVNEQLAGLSNLAVYSTMVVFFLSFLSFSADAAAGGSARKEPEEQPVMAGGIAIKGASTPTNTANVDDVDAPRRRFRGIGFALAALGTALLAAAVVMRGLSVMRVPWGNMYEFALTTALILAALFVGATLRPKWAGLPAHHDLRWVGTLVTGIVLVILGPAVLLWYTEAAQLVPALQEKVWLAIHVFIAITSSAIFALGFAVTVAQLLQARAEGRGKAMSFLPASSMLDTAAHRLHAISFPLWTFTVIAGAIWAQKAWGRYWNWDPKEVGSFIVFVVYAAYLHAHATGGWRKKAPWIAVAGFAMLVANFTVVNQLFSGLHSYAGIG